MSHLLPYGRFINPGPFNIKGPSRISSKSLPRRSLTPIFFPLPIPEHTLITIMSGVAQGNAYATNILVGQSLLASGVEKLTVPDLTRLVLLSPHSPEIQLVRPLPLLSSSHSLIPPRTSVSSGQDWHFSYKIMLVLSTQLIGFSMGGVLRRFLVWPAAMICESALQ